jgi:hypothetical protein
VEDIELLRFFELGKKILMVKTSEDSIAVDYPEDIKKVEKQILYNENKIRRKSKKILDKIRKKIILNKTSSEFDIFRYLSNSNKLSFTQLQFYLKKKTYLNTYSYVLKIFSHFFFIMIINYIILL